MRCMPRMPDCGALRIGVDSSEPKTPPLVIVKVPPCMSSMRELAVAGALAEVGDRLLDVGERRRSASRTTGTTRPLLGADGDADVVVVLVDDVVAVDLGVDRREVLQRLDGRPSRRSP